MDNSKILQDIKQSIIEFDYPLANSMSDTELADIFRASNRCFLISWMLLLIDIKTCDNVSKETLGQLLYENGFCLKEESLPFMTATLDISEQLRILNRMFNFIRVIRKPINENFKPVSLDELENLSKNTMNLFPMFGEIKVLNHETNAANMTEIINENENCEGTFMKSNGIEINNIVEQIQLDLPDIKSISENYQKQDDTPHNNMLVEAEQVFRKCKDNVNVICNFLKDIKIIEEVTKYKEDIEVSQGSSNSDLLIGICEEICNIIRIQKL